MQFSTNVQTNKYYYIMSSQHRAWLQPDLKKCVKIHTFHGTTLGLTIQNTIQNQNTFWQITDGSIKSLNKTIFNDKTFYNNEIKGTILHCT